MYKSDLAHAYNPTLSIDRALHLLNQWIDHYPGLRQRLIAIGLTKKQKVLTPAQVRLITDALGEP